MSFSIQTNVNSLIAQENLRINGDFQSQTITRLTSGFRINQSGDDAAGLAIANKFRSDVAELSQGVRNANDGISTLQIIDGGMNNVSKMLDRLKTLATQSASDTFTGDRTVLNQEFQSLLSEIDRQSRTIGLDQNGQFAKSLSVYIGGGKAHGSNTVSIDNGSVTVDLRSSAVDTQSLGLKGMQVVTGEGVDIGTGSSTHTVAQILGDNSNTTSTPGYSDFYFAGPGFADGSKVKVSVNLGGVTDVDTLVTAINTAIASAAGGTSQAAAAFKDANIVASVHTDDNNGKELAFTSSVAAFQVEAGDVMANALMGNLTGTTGTALDTTVTGAVTQAGSITPANVTLRIAGGGLTDAVELSLDTGSNTAALAITDLVAKVSNNVDLKAAGISLASTGVGDNLHFTDSRGEKFSVMLTGDPAGLLGLGSFLTNTAGDADYDTIDGQAYAKATAYGTAKLEVSLNGAASDATDISVDLNAGDATAGKYVGAVNDPAANAHGTALTVTVDGTDHAITIAGGATTLLLAAADINTQLGAFVTASVNDTGHMVLTSVAKGANTTIAVSQAAAATLFGAGSATAGASRTADSVVEAINSSIAGDTSLQAAGLVASQSGNVVTLESSNGTYFRVNAGGSGTHADLGFGVAGATFTSTLAVGTAKASATDANGAYNSTAITFGAMKFGNDDQTITLSANDVAGNLQSKTITLRNDDTAQTGRSIDEAIAYVNQQLQQSNNPTLQKIVAVKEFTGGGAEKINFLSQGKFSVSVAASANTGDGLAGGALTAGTVGDGSANMTIDTKAGAQQAVSAIASAIGVLGSAQAAVGKGQNQLGYALGLAQSQISNYSAAESRIRDADIASEAANLTKAQVLQQASIAAMAQANSAPQAVLSLLRG